MMSEESNGNRRVPAVRAGGSNEDLSEYTDADESISAPTEFLAEFLSALMLKDYTSALKYCKLILQYEPNNSTAKEFHPLILEKINQASLQNYCSSNESSSEDSDDDLKSDSLEHEASTGEQTTNSDKDEELVPSLEISFSDNTKPDTNMENDGSIGIKGSDGTTNSYSSLEDEEIIRDDNTLEEVIVEDNYTEGDNNGNTVTLTGYSHILPSSDEDYNFNWFTKIKPKAKKNRNTLGISSTSSFQVSSDSESPTDPVTQQTIEMLRAKFVQATN